MSRPPAFYPLSPEDCRALSSVPRYKAYGSHTRQTIVTKAQRRLLRRLRDSMNSFSKTTSNHAAEVCLSPMLRNIFGPFAEYAAGMIMSKGSIEALLTQDQAHREVEVQDSVLRYFTAPRCTIPVQKPDLSQVLAYYDGSSGERFPREECQSVMDSRPPHSCLAAKLVMAATLRAIRVHGLDIERRE